MPRYNDMDEVPDLIKSKLARFISNVGGRTFVIQGLPPELTGGALARYSRAKTGMQLTLLNEFFDENGEPNQEKGSALMDRVLNAFGDDSVGELEGTHLGIEDVSQLLTKFIEDRRIGGSPIEQSTRYVMYDQKDKDGKWRYLRPKEIQGSKFIGKFELVNDRCFEVYSKAIGLLTEFFKKQFPREEFQIEVERNSQKTKAFENELFNEVEIKSFNNAYSFTIRCAALDVGRCVLPSSTLTHLGIFGNGRFFSNLISTLKSQDLMESVDRGFEIEAELKKVIPTFVKRNKANPKMPEINKNMAIISSNLLGKIKPEANSVTLIQRASRLDEVAASCLFPYTNISLKQIIDRLRNYPDEIKINIIKNYAGQRDTRRDRTGRAAETGYPITFDLVGGFAEYRDLERHRMLTQQRQPLTTELGFIMPPEMKMIGMEKEVEEVVSMMEELHQELKAAGLRNAAQYTTLFNHRMRFMLGMNFRELQHLTELRTQPAGHFSYRAMCQEMARQVMARDPWTKQLLAFVDFSDPGNKISRAKEQSRIAGKNIATGTDSSLDL